MAYATRSASRREQFTPRNVLELCFRKRKLHQDDDEPASTSYWRVPTCPTIKRVRETSDIQSERIPDGEPRSDMNEFSQSDANRDLPFLHIDIVSEMVKWLPLNDRKTCRLVCKLWYQACRDFEPEEKLSIHCLYPYHVYSRECVDEIFTTLLKSSRRCFHLEFHGFSFGRNAEIEFWRGCGKRILSLTFKNCKVTTRCFGSIVKYCVKLETLIFYMLNISDVSEKLGIAAPHYVVQPSDLCNVSLRTLKIFFKFYVRTSTVVWPRLICTLWHLFPRISTFGVCQYDFSKPLFRSSPYFEHNTEKFIKYLSREQMKSICVTTLFCPKLLSQWLRKYEFNLTTFTEITLDVNSNDDMKTSLAFLREQECTSKVTIFSEISEIRESHKEFVSSVLEVITLRELQLFLFSCWVHWHPDWTTSLCSSNVKTLRIICGQICFPNPTDFTHPPNKRLTTLALRYRDPRAYNILPYLRSFPSMETLSIATVDGQMLRAIDANLIKLRSFTVREMVDEETISSEHTYYPKALQELVVPHTFPLEAFQCDRLKFLRITDKDVVQSFRYFNFNEFKTYRCLCPSLEVIRIDRCIFVPPDGAEDSSFASHKEWFVCEVAEFVARLPYLRVLCFEFVQEAVLTETDALIIFQRSSSLRILFVGNAFIKDVITNQIRLCSLSKSDLNLRFSCANELTLF